MPNRFDRSRLVFRSLAERSDKVRIERDHIDPDSPVAGETGELAAQVERIADDILRARRTGRPVILAFGAHAVKNGLSPVLIRLIEDGLVTHLATNGAGIIHDWEFAFRGTSSEDVRANVADGTFGMWRETGLYLNLAIDVGAFRGLGYGEAVGRFVHEDGLLVPSKEELEETILRTYRSDPSAAAAAADLLSVVTELGLAPGRLAVPHRFKRYGLQAAAFRLGVPFTGHPMFGHDIIYTHPANHGASIGRTAERDFLSFAGSVSGIGGGVYLSVGSAVMSPMIFEKSLSMARNLALQEGRSIEGHAIYVVDLAESKWDWSRAGEPPMEDPAYYLRYCKTFSRMGGKMEYVQADNRTLLPLLYRRLVRDRSTGG